MDQLDTPQELPDKKNFVRIIKICIYGVFALSLCISFLLNYFSAAPLDFEDSYALEITSGMSVRDIAHKAAQENLVRSELFLYSILTYSYDPTNIYAGTYIFEQPATVFAVAQKLAANDIENNLVRITIPEGVSVQTIARIATKILPDFDDRQYIVDATPKEGYLFPETYFIPEEYTAEDLLKLQEKTYKENTALLQELITNNPLSEHEVLILASIVEREANDEASMKMVAGILQNRLNINMPLQADASIEYTLDKPLSELTAEDLKIDSPYNTYLNTGLPPTPIGNPGLMAITAVLQPTLSDNFFYITSPDGIFHYAETFVEHNRNIAKYLR